MELKKAEALNTSTNQTYIFTSDNLGTLKKWDAKKHVLLEDMGKIHNHGIFAMCSDPNGQFLVTTSGEGDIKIWDVNTCKLLLQNLDAHEGLQIDCCDIDSTGRHLFTGGANGIFRMWDTKTLECTRDYKNAHGCSLTAMKIHGDFIYTGDAAGTLKLWTISVKKRDPNAPMLVPTALLATACFKSFGPIHPQCVDSMVFTSDGQWMFSGDSGGYLKQFDNKKKVLEKNYQCVTSEVSAMAISNNDEYVFVSNDLGSMKQFSVSDKRCIASWDNLHEMAINALAISENDTKLWTAGTGGVLKCWSFESQELVMDYGEVHEGTIYAMEYV